MFDNQLEEVDEEWITRRFCSSSSTLLSLVIYARARGRERGTTLNMIFSVTNSDRVAQY